jgi:hypothetical protein
MNFASFLSSADADRAARTLAMLRGHCIEAFVLTGGTAIELHRLRHGLPPQRRSLNDIDFLAASFCEIPATLSSSLLFRHVHPHDPPGKTLLQCVDPETALRVDIFRACGSTMARAISIELCGARMRMISIEDLIARTARLCMDIAAGDSLPMKRADDLLRMLPLAGCDEVEPVWREHRKPNHPESFAEATVLLRELFVTRKDLQIEPVYSHEAFAACSRCESTDGFPLADAADVLSLLGYY